MTEENTINEDILAIIKALTEKVESLEKMMYSKDSLMMKAGLVVSDSPIPAMDNSIGGVSSLPTTDVSSMDWSDIHKMVSDME